MKYFMKDDGTIMALAAVGVVAAASLASGRQGSKAEVPKWLYFKDGEPSHSRVAGWDRAEWWYDPYETYVYVTSSNPSSPIHQYQGMKEGVVPGWVRQSVKRHPPR